MSDEHDPSNDERISHPTEPTLRAALDALRNEFAAKLPGEICQLIDELHSARREESAAPRLRKARDRAHRLRGSVGAYGYAEVGEIAGRIEEILDSLPPGPLNEHSWAQLRAEIDALDALVAQLAFPASS